MTLNDLECSIQVKVGFMDGTLDVRLLWLSELAMRDWMTASDKNEANELWFQSTRGEESELSRWTWLLFTLCIIISQISWDVWPFGICSILKALNGFLMIQKQMNLKVYNVWKLHRPRMSHGLLADCVDTRLASLLYSCTTDAVFSEVPRKTCVADALSLCGSWASCLFSQRF